MAPPISSSYFLRWVLDKGVYEPRLAFGAGYRVYFAEQDTTIVILLCGGNKSTQTKDIGMAKQYWQELRERSL